MQKVFAEFAKVLKPGGVAVIVIGNATLGKEEIAISNTSFRQSRKTLTTPKASHLGLGLNLESNFFDGSIGMKLLRRLKLFHNRPGVKVFHPGFFGFPSEFKYNPESYIPHSFTKEDMDEGPAFFSEVFFIFS